MIIAVKKITKKTPKLISTNHKPERTHLDQSVSSDLVRHLRPVDPVYFSRRREVANVPDDVGSDVTVVVASLPVHGRVAVGVGDPQVQTAVVSDEGGHAGEGGANEW